MTQQGWSEGQALGARSPLHGITPSFTLPLHHSGLSTDAERLAAARVGVLFKDDTLGLGAKRKGNGGDIEGQRIGLDAFQGLLGRLNGKSEDSLREEERKVEGRRLEMFVKGRWGGVVFVSGGLLVGSVGEKDVGEVRTESEQEAEALAPERVSTAEQVDVSKTQTVMNNGREERRRRKEAKRQRKEDKRKRREAESSRKTAKETKREAPDTSKSQSDKEAIKAVPRRRSVSSKQPDEPLSSTPSDGETQASSKHKVSKDRQKRKSSSKDIRSGAINPAPSTSASTSRSDSSTVTILENGRHLLRGRNIQAKRMVLSDLKGLDQIFMR